MSNVFEIKITVDTDAPEGAHLVLSRESSVVFEGNFTTAHDAYDHAMFEIGFATE